MSIGWLQTLHLKHSGCHRCIRPAMLIRWRDLASEQLHSMQNYRFIAGGCVLASPQATRGVTFVWGGPTYPLIVLFLALVLVLVLLALVGRLWWALVGVGLLVVGDSWPGTRPGMPTRRARASLPNGGAWGRANWWFQVASQQPWAPSYPESRATATGVERSHPRVASTFLQTYIDFLLGPPTI